MPNIGDSIVKQTEKLIGSINPGELKNFVIKHSINFGLNDGDIKKMPIDELRGILSDYLHKDYTHVSGFILALHKQFKK